MRNRATKLGATGLNRFKRNPLNLASWKLFNNNELSPLVTSTRTTKGWYFDSTGTLQEAAANTPRVSYDPTDLSLVPFLLAEEARTNSIRNNTMQGAVAGSFPLLWPASAWTGANPSEIAITSLGGGVENGINYIDVRAVGTATSAGDVFFASFEPTNSVAALNGQTWSLSCFARVISGQVPAGSIVRLRLSERNSSGGNLTDGRQTIDVTAAALRQQRYTYTRTNVNASTAFLFPSLILLVPSGTTAIDITLRIGLPQLELGATASSPILTYGTAVTRSADNLSVTNLAATGFNAAEGTLYAHWLSDMPVGTGLGFVATLTDNATSSSSRQLGIQARSLSNQIRVWQSSAGVSTAGGLDDFVTPVSTAFSGKAATGWGSVNVSAAANGSTAAAMLNPIESTAFNTLLLGRLPADQLVYTGRIYQAAIIPKRLPDASLQKLTRI